MMALGTRGAHIVGRSHETLHSGPPRDYEQDSGRYGDYDRQPPYSGAAPRGNTDYGDGYGGREVESRRAEAYSESHRGDVHVNGYGDGGRERGPEARAYAGEGRGTGPGAEAAQLVEAVTAAGGVRVQPSREALQEFVARAERLRGRMWLMLWSGG